MESYSKGVEVKMRISFDLDGVICNSEKWFYGILNSLRHIQPSQTLNEIEILYYSSRQVRYNPYQFMASQDVGFIVTARRLLAFSITEDWLDSHNIGLPVVFIDQDSPIDWTDYEAASYEAAARKAEVIRHKGINIHFDNNPYLVMKMRTLLPNVTVVQVGGEPCLSSM